jgi:hypothetical protein
MSSDATDDTSTADEPLAPPLVPLFNTHRPLAPPPDPNRISLNPSAYPHIMDMIVVHLARAALLQVRQVSVQLRKTADKRLAKHIVLTKFRGKVVTTLPFFHSKPFRRFDFWDTPELTSAVTILDIPVGFDLSRSPSPPSAYTALPNVRVIRDLGSAVETRSSPDAQWIPRAPITDQWISFQRGQVPSPIPNNAQECITIVLKNRPDPSWIEILPPSPVDLELVMEFWDEYECECASECGFEEEECECDKCQELLWDAEAVMDEAVDLVVSHLRWSVGGGARPTVTFVDWEGFLALAGCSQGDFASVIAGTFDSLGHIDDEAGDKVDIKEQIEFIDSSDWDVDYRQLLTKRYLSLDICALW